MYFLKIADQLRRLRSPLSTCGGMIHAVQARRTAVVIAALTIFVSLALLAVVALSGGAMNRAAQRTEERFIGRELDRAIASVLDEQKSVALWDEAVVRIRANDTDWLDDEIGAYLNGSYGHDEVYLFDADDRPFYAYPRPDREGQIGLDRIGKAAAPLLRQVREVESDPHMRVRSQDFIATHAIPHEITGASALRWSAHLLNLDGQPAIVSAMSVIPTTHSLPKSQKPPVIVSIFRLGANRLHAMGAEATIPDLHLNRGESHSNVVASIDLKADDGQPIGKLEWTPGHPGKELLSYILPLLVMGTLWAMYATLAMLRRLIAMSRGLENSELAARRLAEYDTLSDLPNRHKFLISLNEWIEAWQEGRGERPLVAYIDLDHFKEVNDTLGHDTGDALVRAVASLLSAALPKGHLLARLGGDEFAVITAASDPLAGWKLGRELCMAFAEPVRADEHDVTVSASIGIAMPKNGLTNSAQLMREADIALYRAKEAGRGRAVIFRPEMAEAVERRRRTELDLRTAIAAGQLRLVYQPVLTIAGAPRFDSVEALLRWNHPERGLISPEEFIPVAETSGQMAALGEWALAQALKDSARWPGLQVAVNLSPVQLKTDGFVRRVSKMVMDSHVRPAQIIFEVTENVMMDATGHAGQALKELGELGFRIALDDFGTGYSSLSYLRKFRFNRLKVDRSFIEGVEDDAEAIAVIEMVVALGRRLGLEVVAEGIENEAQAKLMKKAGCTHLQGWFVARPLESGDVARMIDTSPRVEPIVEMLRGSVAHG